MGASDAVAWHATPADEVLARLESRPDGLTIVEAQRRLAEHGPNALTRQRGPSAWQVLVRQFTSPLIYALLASSAVAFALGDVPDGAVVLAVVVLNALIGFAGPRVIEQTIRQTLPEGFQRSEFLLEHGILDFIVDRSEMKATLARCLRMLYG